MGQGVLLSAGADIDFMVHGVFSYEIFGQTAWITTTHICVLIVMLVLTVFSILAGRTMKKAEELISKFKQYEGLLNGLISEDKE